MAKNENKRLRPVRLEQDQKAYAALQSFDDYQPSNPDFSAQNVGEVLAAMKAAEEAEVNAQCALTAAREATLAAEWAFHNAVLGVKDQVMAQYGSDSDHVQALGLKKKSDRKSSKRKGKNK